ncbi:MAG TPA: response regulator [Luteitalea sp.]|nr:response regulator [Luteitalea sp.]
MNLPLSDTDLVTPLVLLVDDYADTRDLYRLALEVRGFRVVEAVNGQEAVELTRALRPAVVLMDLSMPVLDGWMATRLLKATPDTAGIPVVALTAHAREIDRTRALDAGCDVFLSKPCLPSHLVERINQVLRRGDAPSVADEREFN